MTDKSVDFLQGQIKGVFLFGGYGKNSRSLLFTSPVSEITCHKANQINACLLRAQRFIDEGYWLAGYFSYELGHFLEKRTGPSFRPGMPLFYLAAFKKPAFMRGLSGRHQHLLKLRLTNMGRPLHDLFVEADPCVRPSQYESGRILPDTSMLEYAGKFTQIKKFIRNGEIYQVNKCFKLKFGFKGNAGAFFFDLRSRQNAEYTAFINDGKRKVLSISPELFFEIDKGNIIMKPMKGTVIKSSEVGARKSELILKNEKNRAENIMIVDLIRNDLGRICETGSVKAGPMFSIKEYETLYQMTSTIKGRLIKGLKLIDVIKALFPSGSVTGAPKIRAMQVIKEIEKSARGIYTGAIGFFGPRMKTAVFNIPIRTIVMENGKAEMGVGSGIVHDSKMKAEYEECLGKAKFLHASLQGNCLIESMLLENGRYFLYDYHVKRLMHSAAYFGVPVDKENAIKALKACVIKHRKGSYKVRLVVDGSGKMKVSVGNAYMRSTGGTRMRVPCRQRGPVETGPSPRLMAGDRHGGLSLWEHPLHVTISKTRMNSADIFLWHKTTHRQVYDREYEKHLKKGFYDVIFFNERGELTEAHSSNIFIRKGKCFYTPPVASGLLPGTYRQYLLSKGGKYREKVLYRKDLLSADGIYICNSVRGMRRVVL